MKAMKLFDKVCIRTLVTLFMFVGVVLFLLPYFTGSMSTGIVFLIVGSLMAVGCGFLRCFLIEGDCNEDKTSGHPRQS